MPLLPLPIHDTFDRPSYSPEPTINASPSTSGHTWTNYRGTHKIGLLAEPGGGPLDSVAYCSNQTLSNAAVAGFDYGTSDVHLAVRIAGGSGDSSRGLAICFDGLAPGSSSQYALNMDGLALTKTVGASSTTLATGLDPNPGQTVEIIKSGGDFSIYKDGVLAYTVNDPSPLTGTRCGIFTRFDQSAPGPDSFYDYGFSYLLAPDIAPPLRQRQRDDDLAQGGPRQRGPAGNPPTSKQRSIRQGWGNTYL